MLADPQLVNTSWVAVRDIEYDGEFIFKKGETYHVPIRKLTVGVYETDLNFNHNIGDLVKDSDWRLALPDPQDGFSECDVQAAVAERLRRVPNRTETEVRYLYCKSQYGVADNYEQVLAAYPLTVAHPERRFCLSVTPMRRSEQPPDGGWRWHKWGEYIGIQTPSGCEYLYDEPDIELVYVFHWYELQTRG